MYEGSTLEFWTILDQIYYEPDIFKPFLVAIDYEQSKPENIYFCEKFVDEINELARNGIIISEKHFKFKVKCFICDIPARKFCKIVVFNDL